jgi:hypothetical protein
MGHAPKSCNGLVYQALIWPYQVTIALLINRKIHWHRAIQTIISQLLASMAASGFVSALLPGPLVVATKLDASMSVTRGLFLEAFVTSMLVLTILMLEGGPVRNAHARTACETYTDFAHLPLVQTNVHWHVVVRCRALQRSFHWRQSQSSAQFWAIRCCRLYQLPLHLLDWSVAGFGGRKWRILAYQLRSV